MSTRTSGQATRRPPDLQAEDSRVVVCSFCRGTGKDPFGILSVLSTCCVCRGKGVLRMDGPHRSCPHCDGSGAVKTFTCGVCRGSGYVPEATGPTVTCPDCEGSGDEHGSPALGCLRCRGGGRVPSTKPH